jgi:hypothetical protein
MSNQTSKFTAKLISVSKEAKPNANGKLVRRCTVEYTAPATGEVVQRAGRIYEANFAYGMEIGQSYATTAQPWIDRNGNAQVDIIMSHLTTAPSASLADFGFTAPVPADLNTVG